jgi:3-oxosteroid 1-dehydrogenase
MEEPLPESIDLVIVGTGIAGLTAAIVAHDLGLAVLVIEKSALIGGTSGYSMGLIWAPANKYASAAGINDAADEAIEHIRTLSGGRHDEAMLAAYVPLVNEALSYLEARADVPWELVRGYPDYHSERSGGKAEGRYISCPVFHTRDELPIEWHARLVHSPYYRSMPTSWTEVQSVGGIWNVRRQKEPQLAQRVANGDRGFGSALIAYLVRACLWRGIEIRTEVVGEHLIRDAAGRVSGISVRHGKDVSSIASRRGVILACGGYDSNRAMQKQLDPHPTAFALGSPSVDGSGINMALEIGAAFETLGGQLLVPTYQIPGEVFDGRPLWRMFVREPALPGSIVVNARGSRFADESFYRQLCAEMARYDEAFGGYPNRPTYFICDQVWRERYDLGPVAAGATAEWIATADSLAELARRLDVDAAGLEQTVSQFNVHARDGIDPVFGRGSHQFGRFTGDRDNLLNPCLRPLEAPFSAIPVELGTSGTNSGLRTDCFGRVVDVRSQVIAGLYAVGNCMANLVDGLWYNSGIAMGRGLAFGYAAGRHAAAAK